MEILLPGAPERQALDGIRAERVKLEAQIGDIAGATLSIDETVARFMGSIRLATEDAESHIRTFARPGSVPDPLSTAAVVGLMAWLDPRSLEASLRKRLKEALPQSGLALSSRPAAIAKLKEQLAEMEFAEEREICRLEDAGFAVERRLDDVDLETLLAVWDEEAA